ncbi:PEGA domain-containing protein [Desulfurivibrio dismutans]|uniref:PEGA domain-containing protein n=1 Tax=Desulfurivibrio dismutans TaxID=1398908 RepID=UPI0023DC4114|nr:PEGA domain-containing protein [Desulfurivibrio alkaliphilus]MDF1615497.1 PEGA domain-containing protein [Desulfurivibrio alkaliphilus]
MIGGNVLITAVAALTAFFTLLPAPPTALAKEKISPGMPSTPDHTWGAPPGQVIIDAPYPPPHMYYPPPGYPGWPPHYHHPGAPPYYRPYYPPFPGYPPYYQRETPWYEEPPPLPAGRLRLLVEPVQAQATINDYPLQRHPDLSFEVGLLPGDYLLQVSAEGYEPQQRQVRIKGGERIHLTVSLERIVEP